LTWTDEDGTERVRKAREDVQWRRQLLGEQAVAVLFIGLFQDAEWYLQGGGAFPDGLPPYAHTPQYLSLFSVVLNTIQTRRNRDEAAAIAAARQQA
jgi:hypothetical protein